MKDYYVDGESGSHLKPMMDACYQNAHTQNAALWQQGLIDKRFKAGDQALHSWIHGNSNGYNSRNFNFNLIRRTINMVSGYQRKNRKSTVVLGMDTTDSQLADDYTACQLYSERKEGAQEYLSQGFEGGSLDVGLGLLHLFPDYTNDPFSGDFGLDNVAFNNFLIDPYWRKMDLSDCNFIWRRRWVSKDAAKINLPGRAKEIDSMQLGSSKDGRFPMQAELMNLNNNKLMPYDEYYYRDFREGTFILDPMSGESVEWQDIPGAPKDEMEQVLAQQPWLQVQKKQVPTIKLGICLAGRTMYDGPNLLNVDRYPFVPMVGYHEPDLPSYSWRFQGIIRGLRDAQFLYNRRKVIELDILESQVNSGWVYPVDAITDEKAFRQTGQGVLVPLKKGHTAAELERIQAPDIPASMIELSRSLSEDVQKISGVNEELLGSAEDDKAGILAMMRQGAGLTTLQGLFDRLDYSQRLLGGLRLEAIRKNWTKAKVERIINREVDPRFFSSDISRYDLAVEEGVYSTTQQQMEFRQLVYLRGELGMPIDDETLINKSSITGKKDIIEKMQQTAQAEQQAQQAQSQQEQEITRADNIVKMAKAKSDLARSKELLASAAQKTVQITEIEAAAEHNQAKADMELVKQLIELEDMDRSSLKNAIDMAELIKTEGPQQSQIIPLTIGE